ncbi:MAG: DUF4340 domain-containing protein [Magnetococcales bacterium]|nr:DUF4340 domain-containing protein [Magnetococcales bacterium]
MSKGWRNNLILTVVMCAAAAGLWIQENRENARDEADKQSRALGSLRSAAITSLAFRDGAGKTLSLQKEGDHWQITAPAQLRTNHKAVTELLETLDKHYEKKAVDTLTDAAAFGLTSPQARLEVKDGSGGSSLLLVGNTAPANPQKRYVALGEKGPVVLMANTDLTKVMQRSDDLRDKRLARTESPDLSRIALQPKSGDALQLARGEGESWNLEAPIRDRADGNRISAWIFALSGSQGSGFRQEPPQGDPDWRVTLTPAKGEPELLSIWRVGEELVAKRPGEPDAMLLPKYLTEELSKNALDLVAMRPVEPRDGLSTLRLEGEGKNLSAEKKEQKWPRDEWREIEDMLGRDALRGALRSGSTPWVTITLGQGEQAQVLTLHQEEKRLLVTPPNRPISLELTPLQAETLKKAIQDLLTPPAS